jgi:hypothetical protein
LSRFNNASTRRSDATPSNDAVNRVQGGPCAVLVGNDTFATVVAKQFVSYRHHRRHASPVVYSLIHGYVFERRGSLRSPARDS